MVCPRLWRGYDRPPDVDQGQGRIRNKMLQSARIRLERRHTFVSRAEDEQSGADHSSRNSSPNWMNVGGDNKQKAKAADCREIGSKMAGRHHTYRVFDAIRRVSK